MTSPTLLNANRLFPTERSQRAICRELYMQIRDIPIVSPHGHTEARWFADNARFANPTELLILPDHYLLRMLYSQGISMGQLGLVAGDSTAAELDPRRIWSLFAKSYYLFAGTPSRIWLDHVFYEIFELPEAFNEHTADAFYDAIDAKLDTDAFRPRALMNRFDIQLIATTDGALNPLTHHRALSSSAFERRVITTFRPDDVIDPSTPQFAQNLDMLSELTGFKTASWSGYLNALRARRDYFKRVGRATATDHGHRSALTADLPAQECQRLLDRCLSGQADAYDQEQFRAQMLTEMAGMSLDDGLVMQLHPGVFRNHNAALFERFGADKGADIPIPINYTEALRPLLTRFGNEPEFRLILFTLDETTYARELAPLAGHYPCLRLGPPWWFNDSPQGMMRFRDQVTDTAGFYNTAGFNDDTRAFLSIPARHDVARRMDCHYLSGLVAEHRMTMDEALRVAVDLSYNLAVDAYKLPLSKHRLERKEGYD